MPTTTTCNGVRRRDFLKAGVIGGTGLTLANYLKFASAGEVASKATANAAIFINLTGGPTHMDTFDLKPEAKAEFRGEFNPIATSVPGIEISEHLPKLAQNMHLFTILRGVTHTLGAHELGTEYVNAGNRPLPSLEYPGYGAIVTKELGGNGNIPPNVAIPSSRQKTGYLGVQYAPLNTGATPKPGEMFSVRGLKLSGGLTIDAVEKRQALLTDLDKTFRGFEETNQLVKGLDKFGQQAHAMITSPKSREAFDVSKESPNFQKLFGETSFDQSCLLATRLVEAGTRFVTIELGGWDTHNDNWVQLKKKSPPLDSGLSGLLQGLQLKGLLETTTVFVTGEFGRTPKINTTRNGRDHYPRCMFMLMAGGGITNGQVVGKSNADATLPDSKGFSPDDVAASLFHTLGISHQKEYHTDTGRPIMIVRDGHVIPELFA
ncbi:MAG: DUF1501 domain-containing protein [Planctomycetaceae bacterium]